MADRRGAPARAWQRMLSGRRLDLLDPSPLDIEITDIAQGLARVARWNGQTIGEHAFSVAQHSLVVERIFRVLAPEATPPETLAALLHDAPEYVVGDMISPFKANLGGEYKEIEKRLQRAVHIRFGLPPTLPPALSGTIKQADQIAAYFEATLLAGFGQAEAEKFFGRPKGFDPGLLTLTPLPATIAQAGFVERFERLVASETPSNARPFPTGPGTTASA